MRIEMNRADLEAEIMKAVKEHNECGCVSAITVQPVDHLPPEPNWKLGAVLRSGPGIPADCNRHITSVVAEMRRSYRLMPD